MWPWRAKSKPDSKPVEDKSKDEWSGFEGHIQSVIRQFYHVLFVEPRAHHDIGTDDPPKYQKVVLIFADGEERQLECYGRGPYDEDADARPKYPADTTREQIQKAIVKKGQKPIAVQFCYVNETPYIARQSASSKYHELTLEFPFSFVEAALNWKMKDFEVIDVPYKIVGGVMSMRKSN